MTDASVPWLDGKDKAILKQLRETYAIADPPPATLDERVLFAIALDNVDVEVSRLREETLIGSGARSTERTRTITFDSENLTIMVSIVDSPGGLVRLDGWLAPAGPLRVELRTAGHRLEDGDSTQVVTADDTGRFVFEHVAHGPAQLLVRRAANGRADVVTPSLIL